MNFKVTQQMADVIKRTHAIAKKYFVGMVGTEHLLYGLASSDTLAGKILTDSGLSHKEIEQVLEVNTVAAIVGQIVKPSGDLELSNTVQQLLMLAQRLTPSITPESVLICIMQVDCTARSIIALDSKIERAIEEKLKELYGDGEKNSGAKGASKLPKELADLGTDMTAKARENKIDPIIGRADEIERIIQILCRKTKNNPVLIGEPGVGKSAVVEGLAKAIIEKKVPDILQNKTVFSLDMASLVAG
ncbi:MAG: hypothetical protein FWD76_05995, partial [Firmicutes bacterium]|nr:hypothetical protein [Bacillota bacterium]